MNSASVKPDPLEGAYCAALDAAGDYDIDIEAFIGYCDNHHISPGDCVDVIDEFYEAYVGQFDDWADFARQMFGDIYDLDSIPDILRNAIDWHAVAASLSADYFDVSGHFFRNL